MPPERKAAKKTVKRGRRRAIDSAMTPSEARSMIRGLSLNRQRALNDLIPAARVAASVLADVGQRATAGALAAKLQEIDAISEQIARHAAEHSLAVFSELVAPAPEG